MEKLLLVGYVSKSGKKVTTAKMRSLSGKLRNLELARDKDHTNLVYVSLDKPDTIFVARATEGCFFYNLTTKENKPHIGDFTSKYS